MEMVESKHLFKLEIGHMNSFLENHQFSRLPMALLYSLIPQKVTDRVTLKVSKFGKQIMVPELLPKTKPNSLSWKITTSRLIQKESLSSFCKKID